jgi:hypothetical protein
MPAFSADSAQNSAFNNFLAETFEQLILRFILAQNYGCHKLSPPSISKSCFIRINADLNKILGWMMYAAENDSAKITTHHIPVSSNPVPPDGAISIILLNNKDQIQGAPNRCTFLLAMIITVRSANVKFPYVLVLSTH